MLKDDLRAALELFGPNGERWVNRIPERIGEHCSVTACGEVASGVIPAFKARAALSEAADLTAVFLLSDWNDSHTWPEVKALFEKAIQSC